MRKTDMKKKKKDRKEGRIEIKKIEKDKDEEERR